MHTTMLSGPSAVTTSSASILPLPTTVTATVSAAAATAHNQKTYKPNT